VMGSKMPENGPRQGERGAALIIVLGLVALISTWAVTAAYEDMLSLRRADNAQDAMRAEQASQSALVLSARILKDDSKDSQTDDLDEMWAMDSPPFSIDDGSVFGQIVDANRFINLNTLVDKNGKVVPEVEKQVKALFTLLELDGALVDALIDWMDADDRVHGSGGAEDSAYYDQDFHIKNARLGDWQEMHLIRGFEDKIVRLLATVAMVREVAETGISTVNLNTASAKVLMAMMPKMAAVDAETLLADRPFDSVAIALQNKPWAKDVKLAYFSVVSDVFIVRTEARFGRVALREKFMIQRQAGGASGKITLLSSARIGREAELADTSSGADGLGAQP